METRNQTGKEKSRKSKKYERSGNMAKDVKKDENGQKVGNLMEPGNRNEIKLMKTDVAYDEEENDATKEAQPKKYENSTSNIDMTNDNTCNSYTSTSARRNIDNGKVTNTETKSVNDEGNKGGGSEIAADEERKAEADTEADTNSEDSKDNGNTGNVKQEEYAGKIKILNKGVIENEIDMTDKVEDDGEDDGVTREALQRKNHKLMATMRAQQQKSDALMVTMMATLAEMRAADTKKGITETTEKEKKEEREELYRKEKEEREELFWKEEKEAREDFHRILSNAGVQDFGIELAKGYRSSMKKDVESDGKEYDVTEIPQGNTVPVRQKFRKFRLKKMERNMKEGNYNGKIKHLRVPGNENKNKQMITIVEYDGEENKEAEEPQPKKCEIPTSKIDTTNDNSNSCTSTSRNIHNGKVTNMETKLVPNDDGNKGERSEMEAETEADTNNEDSNSGNTGIGSSNSKCNGVDTKTLKLLDENEDKKTGNNE